ncbi:TPA: VirB4 family type IV secretion system protein [Clostridioides difficile]|nr:ATP-binding protein [Clostridioides difficile]HBG5350041.1 VirB4 family type IV secretion system protein [Clostridioides difficile]
MDFKQKTTTYDLIDQKIVKKMKQDKKIKLMDEIIGIQEVLNNTIIKSKYGYSVILKISTTDVALLSEDDIKQFENVLISYSFGLNFPIKYARSNKKQDFKHYKEFIDKKMDNNESSDFLKKYKEELYNEFSALENGIYSDTKYNYIYIVTPNHPIQERALKELQGKVNYVVRALNDTNFRVSTVKGIDIIEFFHNQFNKGKDFIVEDLIEKGIFSEYVEGLGILRKEHEDYDDGDISILSKEDLIKVEFTENLTPEEEKKLVKNRKKDKKKKQNKKDEQFLEIGRLTIYDIIKPNIFEEKEDYIKLDRNNYIRMLSIQTFPKNMNISTLNNLCCVENMELLSIVKKLDETTLSKSLKNQYSKIMSNINIEYKSTGTVDYDKREAAKNIDNLRMLIETNSDKLYHTQNLMKLWSNDLADLENKTSMIIETCEKIGIIVKVLFYDQRDAFLTTLPFNSFNYMQDKRNMTTGGTACLVPSGCTHLNHTEGKYIGRNEQTNSTLILDNFLCQKKHIKESELYSNPNLYICGKPGSGKSTFMKVFMGRGALLGEWNAVFDMENEYEKINKKFGGNYLHIKAGRKIGINPLELSVEEDENGRRTVPIYEKMVEITNLINNFIKQYRNGKGLVGTEITGVQDAIKKVYSDRGIGIEPDSLIENNKKKKLPILSDLKATMEKNKNLDEVSDIMQLITGDGVMAMFDCETSEEISRFKRKKLIVFCLKQLDEFSKFFAMTTILSWLWGLFSDWKYKGIQKNVWIDEGWKFAQHEASLALLEDFSRRGRKYWISLIISTQAIGEFLTKEAGKAIINLCSTKIIFKQDASLAKEITKFFGLPEQARKRIPSFSKGQCILVTEVGNILAQIDLFNFEKEFAET